MDCFARAGVCGKYHETDCIIEFCTPWRSRRGSDFHIDSGLANPVKPRSDRDAGGNYKRGFAVRPTLSCTSHRCARRGVVAVAHATPCSPAGAQQPGASSPLLAAVRHRAQPAQPPVLFAAARSLHTTVVVLVEGSASTCVPLRHHGLRAATTVRGCPDPLHAIPVRAGLRAIRARARGGARAGLRLSCVHLPWSRAAPAPAFHYATMACHLHHGAWPDATRPLRAELCRSPTGRLRAIRARARGGVLQSHMVRWYIPLRAGLRLSCAHLHVLRVR